MLSRFNGTTAFFELLAIKLGVGPVLCADTINIAGRARTEAVERTAAPVIDVVATGEGGMV